MTRIDLSIDNLADSLSARSPQLVENGPTGRAAVAVILHEEVVNDPRVLIIERARRAGDPWSGDLAFPGGRLEADDAGDRDAAERETREEVGLDLSSARLLGRLDDRAARVLPLAVCAFVYAIGTVPALVLSEEVSAAFWIRLADLVDSDRHCEHLQYPAIEVLGPGHPLLWGVTYFFLYALLRDIGHNLPLSIPRGHITESGTNP